MSAQAPVSGQPLPAPLGDALPAPRRPGDDVAASGAPAATPGTLLPDALLPDALLPDALLPESLLPEALLPGPTRAALPAAAPLRPLPAGPDADARVSRTESARIALARARLRGVPVPDVVVFVSACPGCGKDAEWHEEREDTRLRVTIACDC